MTTRDITQSDLDALLPAESAVAYEWSDVRDDYVRTIQVHDPFWPAEPDSLLAKACDALAYITVANRETRNRIDADNDVTRATGEALERIELGEGLLAVPGVTDGPRRLRIINSRRRRTSTATPSGLHSAVLDFAPEHGEWSIASSDEEVQTNGQTVNIAALKATPDPDGGHPEIEDLDAADRALLQAYLESDSVQPFGYTFTAVATTPNAYTIAANVRIEDDAIWATVSQLVTAAALEWVRENDVVSRGLSRLGLQAAMGCVAGVRYCQVTTPAADTADAFGHHHVGPADGSGVALTQVTS